MIFDIINMSDPYTVEADSKAVVSAAIMGFSRGQYAVDDEQGETVCPVFILGGDPFEWFKQEFGEDFQEFWENHREEIATCLDSVLIGSFQDRKFFEKSLELIDDPEKKKQFAESWHDERRTSLNDIGLFAKELAARIRESMKAEKEKCEDCAGFGCCEDSHEINAMDDV